MHVTGRMPAIEIAYSTRRGVKTLAGLNITDGGSICTSKGGSIQFSAEATSFGLLLYSAFAHSR